MSHKKIFPLLEDYARGALSAKERQQVEAHLQDCETCRNAVKQYQAGLNRLRESAEQALSPEARLRVYERLNEERQRRGEQLLQIPAALLAQVRAKTEAAASAAADLLETTAQAAEESLQSSLNTVQTAGEGAKAVGEKAVDGMLETAGHGKNMVHEAGQTTIDSARIMGEKAAEIVEETLEKPSRVIKAPLKMAQAGLKTGWRMGKGALKMAISGAKGTLSAAKGGVKTGAEAVQRGKETGQSAAEAAKTITQGAADVADSTLKGLRKIKDARPKTDDESEQKK